MPAGDIQQASAGVRPPRAMAWVLMLAFAAAVLVVGLMGTALVVASLGSWPIPGPRAVAAVVGASILTVFSLTLRGLRWVFLLRRTQVRIPLRDACIGYFAGLSLLFVPLLIGETAVRAFVQRARGNVPIGTTVVVNLWDRLLDLAALGAIAGAFGLALGHVNGWTLGLLAFACLTLAAPVRRLCLQAAFFIAGRIGAGGVVPPLGRTGRDGVSIQLAGGAAWMTALATSVAAWLLPGVGFWLLVGVWDAGYGLAQAEYDYASSSSAAGILLAPGGILVAGTRLLTALEAQGLPLAPAAFSVIALRLATVGVATILGWIFVVIHLRSAPQESGSHFDAVADAYDVQIPEARRQALLTRKTELMRDTLERLGPGTRGIDVGCGQGWYVARMRQLGFDTSGIDESAGQIQLAARHVAPDLVGIGSVLNIPAADASYDFAYVINVLHHLSSIAQQRRAFAELFRVLRPGGVLFVHEINTRNILFRFYMGYVFPSLNCIDEGVEQWLMPDRMLLYTDAPVTEIRYFTFLPDFLPERIVRLLAPVERLLEASPLKIYSAHYLAVLRKDA